MIYEEYLELRSKAFKLLWETSKKMTRWSSPVPDHQPYWTHPLHVYLDMIKAGIDHYPALLAAILHDIVEDTAITLDDVEREFGLEVREIVDLVSKSAEFNDSNAEEFYSRIMESKNKWAMYIKVFDRIDNLLTYAAFDKNLQQTKIFIDEAKKFFILFAKEIGLEKKLQNAIEYTEAYYLHSIQT